MYTHRPSFNGALASGEQQHRVVINTVLALTASCIAAFFTDALLRHQHKFDMVSIQNATLAGGVAVGSSADLVIDPWGALTVGLVAGILRYWYFAVHSLQSAWARDLAGPPDQLAHTLGLPSGATRASKRFHARGLRA